MHDIYAINEQRTVITFILVLEVGYEQQTSHDVRTFLGALDIYERIAIVVCPVAVQKQTSPPALREAPKHLNISP